MTAFIFFSLLLAMIEVQRRELAARQKKMSTARPAPYRKVGRER